MKGYCNICGGNDDDPAEHTDDCELLSHIVGEGRGCMRCGFTGLASGPAFDREKQLICDKCGGDPMMPKRCRKSRRVG